MRLFKYKLANKRTDTCLMRHIKCMFRYVMFNIVENKSNIELIILNILSRADLKSMD